jgi:hypothetical protein
MKVCVFRLHYKSLSRRCAGIKSLNAATGVAVALAQFRTVNFFWVPADFAYKAERECSNRRLPLAMSQPNSITFAHGLTVAEKIFCESGAGGVLFSACGLSLAIFYFCSILSTRFGQIDRTRTDGES